jgi:MFS family permease
MPYRRNRLTWTAFGALFAFGYVNAVLGPSLPYIRSAEGISYVLGAAHQVAIAVGGGLAGLLSTRDRLSLGRQAAIAFGLAGAGLAGLAVGYGDTPAVTIAAALLMGCLATLALIRVWAALADAHGPRRAVAMSEGEVAVSLAGIVTPLLIGGLAGSAATWRFAFVIGAMTVASAVLLVLRTDFPEQSNRGQERQRRSGVQPTLVVVVAIVGLEFALSFWLASYLNESVHVARDSAVALVSVLYAANLAGRFVASRLARTQSPERVLILAMAVVLCGLPFLLAATTAITAVAGIVLAGAGIAALFPLTSSLHVQATGGTADSALGEILSVAAIGQMGGPLLAGAIAQAANLRLGLLVMLPTLLLFAAIGLTAHRRQIKMPAPTTRAAPHESWWRTVTGDRP